MGGWLSSLKLVLDPENIGLHKQIPIFFPPVLLIPMCLCGTSNIHAFQTYVCTDLVLAKLSLR